MRKPFFTPCPSTKKPVFFGFLYHHIARINQTYGRLNMKEKYRLTFALCVTALFIAGVAFGAINLTNYTTDMNETNENETNATEIAHEAGDSPVDTAVAFPEETTIEPAIPTSTPNPIPGFGIMATIMFVLFAIYLTHKGK
jgi:hypothetical protein